MKGDWYELKKLVHLSGVRCFADMRIVHRKWDIRVTPSGRSIWSPRPMTQPHETGSFQEALGSVCHGDVILVFKRSKLKLVGVAMNKQRPTSCDEYLSVADLRGNGCFIKVEPLYIAQVGLEDDDEFDPDHDHGDGDGADFQKTGKFDESISVIEQIRAAQSSPIGLSLAHNEISVGRKNSGWTRWVFPTLRGAVVVGERAKYRLTGLDEAVQFLRDPELGPNYLKSVGLVWSQIAISGLSAFQLMGSDADSDELRASLELFLEAWAELDAEQKVLPEMQEFSLRVRQLLEYINPLL